MSINTIMEIITREQALHRGLVRFYTGRPCKHGHRCERHTKSNTCVECGNQKSHKWNVDRHYSAQYRKANREVTKQYAHKWRVRNPEKQRKYSKTAGARLIATLNQMKRRAAAKGIEFTLTKDDLIIPEKCPILGIPLERSSGIHNENSPSFDRVDNTRGYTQDNVRVISWRANRLKADASLEELEAIVDYIKQHKKNNNACPTNIHETSTSSD